MSGIPFFFIFVQQIVPHFVLNPAPLCAPNCALLRAQSCAASCAKLCPTSCESRAASCIKLCPASCSIMLRFVRQIVPYTSCSILRRFVHQIVPHFVLNHARLCVPNCGLFRLVNFWFALRFLDFLPANQCDLIKGTNSPSWLGPHIFQNQSGPNIRHHREYSQCI